MSSSSQVHSTSGESLDDAAWSRAKRQMQEKARLYAAMKRGDVEDDGGRHMVDFDRKWVETVEGEEKGEDEDEDDSDDEVVEYTDEFGRSRRGTRGEASLSAYAAQRAARGERVDDDLSARPNMPSNLIYGDTVQAAAFNPDEQIATAMEELAAKRDRELTPPDAVHYDARKEVRSKGTGFFQFSGVEEERTQQMENLEKERLETERVRKERDEAKERRRAEIEERRKAIKEKRSKILADKFLDELSGEIAEKGAD